MPSPCRAAGVPTRSALLTVVPRCSRQGADAPAALAPPPAAAERAVLRHARLRAGAAVTILPRPAALAETLSAVTHAVTYKTQRSLKQQQAQKRMNNARRSHIIAHLRRAPRGSGHRSNCHTRSTARRRVQSWTRDTHTGHSSTGPDRCIARTHCSPGSYSTKRFLRCIRTLLPGTPADTRTRRTGMPPGPRCTGCRPLQVAAGSHTSKETPVPPPDCPADPPV